MELIKKYSIRTENKYAAQKHKKILNNFNFPAMVERAGKKYPDLNQRIQRFSLFKQLVSIDKEAKYDEQFFNTRIIFDQKGHYFKLESDLMGIYENPDMFSTECEKKYIGHYFYGENRFSWPTNKLKCKK